MQDIPGSSPHPSSDEWNEEESATSAQNQCSIPPGVGKKLPLHFPVESKSSGAVIVVVIGRTGGNKFPFWR